MNNSKEAVNGGMTRGDQPKDIILNSEYDRVLSVNKIVNPSSRQIYLKTHL